jgi:hypothetical protein
MSKTATKDTNSAADARATSYITGHCGSGDCGRCNGADGRCTHECHGAAEKVAGAPESAAFKDGAPGLEQLEKFNDKVSGGGDSEEQSDADTAPAPSEAPAGESLPQISADMARDLTDRIKFAVEGVWLLVKEAYTSRAWSVLGYESWDDYCTREFGASRLRLPREERPEVVASLRESGLSLRAIAAATGESKDTIARELSGVSNETPEPPPNVKGTDGKSYSSRRPARDIRPGDRITDDSGDRRRVAKVEDAGAEVVIHDGQGDAVVVDKELDVEPGRAPRKADLGGGIAHPARFSDDLLDVFAGVLEGYEAVLDPFAGSGRIHELMDRGVRCTWGVEIEPEWAALHERSQIGNALDMPFGDGEFDAICTSPTYGNRLADHHDAADPETRRSYAHDLGRPLATENSGAMQWGQEYRAFHALAWEEATRVLRTGGLFVLNIKDHIRDGERQAVSAWHLNTLMRQSGLWLRDVVVVGARGMRAGANSALREPHEFVFVLKKPEA